MIRRISKNNDLKDLIKSCPSGVIDDIYSIRYYIDGHSSIEIEPYFSKVNNHLEVVIPSSMLKLLHNGVLMRRALYRVADPEYPDGYYDMEFIDEMDVWLGDDEEDEEYLTPQDLKTINGMSIVGVGNLEISAVVPDYYATKSWVSEQGYVTSTALSGYATEEYVTTALSSYATESWVSAQGYLSSIPEGYATEAWVTSQGYITSIPSEYATQSWVESQAYITSEALSGYATESWVSAQGYLSSIPEGYATEAWVTSQGYITSIPSEYATQSWVESQAYITSEALSGYATESWVSAQGFLTSETLPSDIATQSWVLSQNYLSSVPSEYATQSWVAEQGYVTSSELSGYAEKDDAALAPLYSRTNGYLKNNFVMSGRTAEFREYPMSPNDTYGSRMVWQLADGTIIGFNPVNNSISGSNPNIYIFNKETLQFDFYKQAINPPEETAIGNASPIWCDHSGRIYYGNKAELDWDSATFNWYSMGGNYQTYQTTKDNIIKIADGIFMVDGANAVAYVFNESTQQFDSTIPVTNAITANNWFRYTYYYNGRYIYGNTNANKQYEFIAHLDAAEPYAEFVEVTEGLPPLAWTYTDPETGTETSMTTQAQYIHPVVINNVTYYALMGYQIQYVFFFIDGEWVADPNFTLPSTFTSDWHGTAADEFWFGFGYNNDSSYKGKVLVWNFGDDVATYGWDNSVDTRLTALEQGYGDALSITNEILG